MKEIYHIYFDCSGSVLIGEKTILIVGFITLVNAKFIDANGKEHFFKKCHVNKAKIAFYNIEFEGEDE